MTDKSTIERVSRRQVIGVVGATAVVSLSGCSDDGDGASGPNGGASNQKRIELSNIEHKTEANVLHYLAGEATNLTDRDLKFQVRIDWFDSDDTLLGESFTQIRADIEAGQTRVWDSTYYNEREHGPPDHYEIEVHIY
ncbi:FxLYD domain-containing protein [Halapricum hydrolyticum]|uniref:FxLYD domain-containing protein n=1 Tax=Halapricum hydrolyticum TaxID=2979991 RepID=A0AAE3IDC9_9EURY|nr:FxLYD domain-containing protein [Halapricum hydrolyticum]MCU4718388.1 FxLYD domain-containing protein [Halapricum hydrolyticum]MCU4726499.1 FxLYD domain-containing protein [Halapricum hydrolyticum]